MIVPGRLDLAGDRHTPFRTTLPIIGIDLTGATLKAQVRRYKDESGTALVDLSGVGAIGTQGLYLVSVATVDGVTVSTLSMHIDETTMEGLPAPGVNNVEGEPGDDYVAKWDMQLTPSGGIKRTYFSGDFTVRADVTQ